MLDGIPGLCLENKMDAIYPSNFTFRLLFTLIYRKFSNFRSSFWILLVCCCSYFQISLILRARPIILLNVFHSQGRSQDFSRGGGGGHTVSNRYRHGVYATEYCRLLTQFYYYYYLLY